MDFPSDWPAEHAAYECLVEEAVRFNNDMINRLREGPAYEDGDLPDLQLLEEFVAPGALNRLAMRFSFPNKEI